MRDFLAFEQHIHNTGARLGHPPAQEAFRRPVYYKGNPTTLTGHEQEVSWPNYTEYMDYELELGLVIDKTGRNLTPDEALALGEHLPGKLWAFCHLFAPCKLPCPAVLGLCT